MNSRKRFCQARPISSSLSIVCLVTGLSCLTAIRALAQIPPPPPPRLRRGGGHHGAVSVLCARE